MVFMNMIYYKISHYPNACIMSNLNHLMKGLLSTDLTLGRDSIVSSRFPVDTSPSRETSRIDSIECEVEYGSSLGRGVVHDVMRHVEAISATIRNDPVIMEGCMRVHPDLGVCMFR